MLNLVNNNQISKISNHFKLTENFVLISVKKLNLTGSKGIMFPKEFLKIYKFLAYVSYLFEFFPRKLCRFLLTPSIETNNA